MVKTEFILFFVLMKSPPNLGEKVSTVQTVKEGDFKESYKTQSRHIYKKYNTERLQFI